MKSVKTVSLAIGLSALLAISFAGCGSEANSKNLEQLYAENGVPVRTEKVEALGFTSGSEFKAVVSGVKESSAYASVADKVDEIKYDVGDFVQKDAVVLTFPTDNPSAQYYQAKLAYENARATYERMQSYFATGGISRQQFEDAETGFKIAEADWNAVRQSVKVKAPISGILTRLAVRESENVDNEEELFTVAQVDRVKARVWVNDSEIGEMSVGQGAVAEWNGERIAGSVVQVGLSMDQMTKAFAVDLEFDNSDLLIRTGVTANITVQTYRSEATIYVERKNVLGEDTDRYVFIHENGLAVKRPVTLGVASETVVEILSGLEPGDELIVEGQMLLEDSTKLNLIVD